MSSFKRENFTAPQKLSWDREKEDIDLVNELLRRQLRTNCSNVEREVVTCKINWIPVMKIKVLDDALFTSPHENVVLRVS